MSAAYIYLSSFFDSRDGRRTGIARVEYKLARELVRGGASVVRFAALRRAFVTLDFQRDVEDVAAAQDLDLESLSPAGDESARSVSGPMARMLTDAAIAIGGPVGVRIFARTAGSLQAEDRHLAAKRLGLFDNPRALIRYQRSRARRLDRVNHNWRRPPVAQFNAGDVILVPGIIWRRAPLDALRDLKIRQGVRIVAYVHDLIPVRHPEFHTDAQGVARFRRYIEAMVEICDSICVNSRFVATDVAEFARASGRRDLNVVTVPLCADITPQTPRRLTTRLAALALEPGKFVVYVSTLNARKNHAGLYDLWRRLMATMPHERVPTLVLAGQKGWGVDELLHRMTADAGVWGRTIKFVEAPTDEEVAYLYATCGFTVFPSLYEGWGLGVTESLAFGKPCIAADNTALREAGQGLAIHMDAHDRDGWLAAVRQLIEQPDCRMAWEARIRREFQPRTWIDIGRDVGALLARAHINDGR